MGNAPATKAPFVLATTNGFGETGEHPPMAAIDGDPRTGWAEDGADGRESVPGSAFCSTDQDRAQRPSLLCIYAKIRPCAAPPSDGFAWRCRPGNTPGRKWATRGGSRPCQVDTDKLTAEAGCAMACPATF